MTANTLKDYADLDGTEWGEAMSLLEQLARYSEYLNPEFAKALEIEIADQLQYVVDNAHIVESTETYTRTVRELEWE